MSYRDQQKLLDELKKHERKFTQQENDEYKMFIKRQKDDEDFDLSCIDDVDEISTKLDLARAYVEMGDAEGAREILGEVMEEGNDGQQAEAQKMLDGMV